MLDLQILTVELYPSSTDEIRIRCYCTADLNAWYVPKAVYKKVAKDGAKFMFRRLFRFSRNADRKEWGQNMAKNPEFYDWVKEVMGMFKEYKKEDQSQ